jgi:hypothetical protein
MRRRLGRSRPFVVRGVFFCSHQRITLEGREYPNYALSSLFSTLAPLSSIYSPMGKGSGLRP